MSSDPAVIERYAAGLNQKAGSRVQRFTLLGMLIGAALGSTAVVAPLVSHVHSWVPHRFAYAAVVVGLAGGAYLGYRIGQSRAVALRLQASMALHQVEIGRILHRFEAMRLPLPDAAALPAPVAAAPALAPAPAPPVVEVPSAPAPVVSFPAPAAPPVPAPQPVASVPPAPTIAPAPAPVAPAPAPAVQLTAVPPTFEWPPTTNGSAQ